MVWTLNSEHPRSNPQGGSVVDSTFQTSKIIKISTSSPCQTTSSYLLPSFNAMKHSRKRPRPNFYCFKFTKHHCSVTMYSKLILPHTFSEIRLLNQTGGKSETGSELFYSSKNMPLNHFHNLLKEKLGETCSISNKILCHLKKKPRSSV